MKNTKTRPDFARRIKQSAATLALMIGLTAGLSIVTAAPASAAEWKCEGPRCWFTLNKEETKKLGHESFVPMNSPGGPWGLVWQFLYLGHKPILIQYAERDMCMQFNLSALPWETQGLVGFNC